MNRSSDTLHVRIDALFVLLLGALTMLPPLSTDVSLPGLPLIARALQASGGTIQWTLSAFILAYGFGQLVLGPLSDRIGRRPVLLWGIVAFTFLAVACAFVSNVYLLIVLRFAQGFSGCAGTVCARAIVADVAKDHAQATSLQAYVSATNASAPIIAPLFGVVLLSFLGWRWLYGSLAFVGIGLIISVFMRLKETAPLVASGLIAGYRRVLAQPRTLALTALVFCAFGAYFALISASSLVLETQMGASSVIFAIVFAINACAATAGSFVAGRFAHSIGSERLLQIGTYLMLLAGLTTFAIDTFAPSPIAFASTMAAVAFCYGLLVPVAFAIVLAHAQDDTGSGAAILGAAQMIGGSFGSALAGALPFQPSISVGTAVLVGVLGVVVAMSAQHKTVKSRGHVASL